MKSLNSMKNYGLALLAMAVMLTTVNAQSRYKHVPRVKVDRNRTEQVNQKQELKKVTPVTQSYNQEVAEVATTETNVENTTVAANNENVVLADKKVNPIQHKKAKAKNVNLKKSNFFNPVKMIKETFAKQMEKQTKLLKVTDKKKANMERWKLLMLIFFIAGGVLLITGIIMYALSLSVVGSWGLYWVGYIFIWLGVACLTAGVVFLILGLTGVMS